MFDDNFWDALEASNDKAREVRTRQIYLNYLAERVLIDCWTTLKCASELDMDPDEVDEDFNRLMHELSDDSDWRMTL